MKIFALVLVLLASPAFAQQTTYTYTGAPLLTGSYLNGYTDPINSPTTQITGEVVLGSPLAPNGVQVVVPLAFTFDGDDLLSSGFGWTAYATGLQQGDPGDPSVQASFSFTTVNGVITDWSVTVSAGNPIQQIYISEGFSLSVAGDQYTDDGQNNLHCSYVPYSCTSYAASNTSAGTWTQALTPAQVSAVQAQLTAAQAQVATLQAQVTSLQGQVATLQTQNATLKEDFAQIAAEIGSYYAPSVDKYYSMYAACEKKL